MLSRIVAATRAGLRAASSNQPGAARAAPADAQSPYADAALFGLVIAIVSMMIVPLPTWLLDVLLASNLALSMLLLVTALRAPHGLSFSSLPTLLLITTLYRLALNVSSTRLILLQGDAGRVIRAFGDFVVQGNYAVGAVVFAIITIIQYLVVAKGSERIAEVGARFTLDALPGKQLAIDSDLRAGALSPDAARLRRAALERESQFYGAMDGAMKFVKGDAIAGVAIAGLCFVGGTALAVFAHGRSLAEGLRVYGLLAIGDALVSQIPSLVISTAAGLVVTRVAERERPSSLAQDIAGQLFAVPEALFASGAFVLALALVPGLPGSPFVLLALLLFGLGGSLRHASPAGGSPSSAPEARIVLELGQRLDEPERTALERRMSLLVEDTCERLDLPRATIGIRTRPELDRDRFTLRLRGAPLASLSAAGEESLGDAVERELAAVLLRHSRELLSLEDVQQKLDAHATHARELARSLVPRAISLPALTELLRKLLDESISLHAWDRVCEAILSCAGAEPHQQLESVRRALRDQIVHDACPNEAVAHRFDPVVEDTIRESIVIGNGRSRLALAPDLARELSSAVRHTLGANPRAVLLTQGDLRRFVFELLSPALPGVTVLSYDELPPTLRVQELAPIRI